MKTNKEFALATLLAIALWISLPFVAGFGIGGAITLFEIGWHITR